MSGIDFCADTNFAIHHLGGHPCVRPYAMAGLAVSVVTELELFSKPKLPDYERRNAELFLGTCEIERFPRPCTRLASPPSPRSVNC